MDIHQYQELKCTIAAGSSGVVLQDLMPGTVTFQSECNSNCL
jgi:hypothetical protein